MCFFENHRLSSSLPPSASVSQRSQVQAPAFLGSWQRYNVKRTPPERNKLQVEQSPQISIFMGSTNHPQISNARFMIVIYQIT